LFSSDIDERISTVADEDDTKAGRSAALVFDLADLLGQILLPLIGSGTAVKKGSCDGRGGVDFLGFFCC
jgi:hypothetical protein